MSSVKIKRIYEAPDKSDGYRMLIDRLWPRGVKKENAAIDEWNKDIASSSELREWFGHDPEKFKEFTARYTKAGIAKKQNLTLLYGAKDTEHNQAVVLQKVLSKMI